MLAVLLLLCSQFNECNFWFASSHLQNVRQSSKESTGSSDSDSSSDDESTQTGATNIPTAGTLQPEKVNHQKESEAGAEISALVNYVQPVHFTSFEVSESKFLLLIYIHLPCHCVAILFMLETLIFVNLTSANKTRKLFRMTCKEEKKTDLAKTWTQIFFFSLVTFCWNKINIFNV